MTDSGRILDAAREVFRADPDASVAAVAERAGVGMSALYRRFASKDLLLQRLAHDELQRYLAEVEIALADRGDTWTAFTQFMRRCVDSGTGAMIRRTADRDAHLRTEALLTRLKHAGVLREDLETADLMLIFEQLQSVAVVDEYRSAQLRRRYLTLMLDSLRQADAPPLPGPAPRWEEISARYRR